MQKSPFQTSIVTLCLIAIAISSHGRSAAAFPENADNLLKNASFERGTTRHYKKDGWRRRILGKTFSSPRAWRFYIHPGGGDTREAARARWDAEIAYHGARSVRIEKENHQAGLRAYFHQEVTLAPDTRYTLRLAYRTTPGTAAHISCKPLFGANRNKLPPTGGEWHEVTLHARTPAAGGSPHQTKLFLQNWSRGTAWFDAVFLGPAKSNKPTTRPSGRSSAANGTLVHEAEPRATIVTPDDSSKTERFAARELQDYVQKISGAKLSIATEGRASQSTRVSIGRTEQFARNGLSVPDSARGEAFVMGQRGGDLFLAGGNDRGTLYAVYAFLEQRLGVHWYAPGELGEVIPKRETIRIERFARRETPDTRIRGFRFAPGKSRRYRKLLADWSVKNRINLDQLALAYDAQPKLKGFYEKRGGAIRIVDDSHNFHTLVPPEKYATSHPEYYPLAKGRRRWSHAQLCLTNPEVRARMTNAIMQELKKHPKAVGHGFSQEDGARTVCHCPNCESLDPSSQGTWKPNIPYTTDRLLTTANLVSQRVRKEHPNKKLVVLAYNNTAQPQTVRPSDGILLELAPGVDRFTAIRDDEQRSALIESWSEHTDQIFYYYLTYMSPRQPMRSTKMLIDDMKYLSKQRMIGVINNIVSIWGLSGHMYNLYARMLWDSQTNPSAFLDRYYDTYYGEASEEVRRFVEEWERVVSDPNRWTEFSWPVRQFKRKYPRYGSHRKKLDRHLAAAMAAAESPRTKRRVRRVQRGWEFCKKYQRLMVLAEDYQTHDLEKFRAIMDQWKDIQSFVEKMMKEDPSALGLDFLHRKVVRHNDEDLKDYKRELTVRKKLFSDKRAVSLKRWQFKKAPHGEGVKRDWHRDGGKGWRSIRAGSFWEDQGHAYDGIAWYRKRLVVPADTGEKVLLYFGGIDDFAWVYVNGEQVGKHVGNREDTWDEPFSVDATETIEPNTENTIAVRVKDVGLGGGMHGGAFMLIEQ